MDILPQGLLWHYENDSKYLLLDAHGSVVAQLLWQGQAGEVSIWCMEIGGPQGVAWMMCPDWPIDSAGQAQTQRWFAGVYPSQQQPIAATCWPDTADAPAWAMPLPPPPPPLPHDIAPPVLDTPSHGFERIEHLLQVQSQSFTDLVTGMRERLDATGAHQSFNEDRLSTLEADLESETQTRMDRARVQEQFMHELVNMHSKQLTDHMADECKRNLDDVNARCDFTETFSREHRESAEKHMEGNIEAMTTHVQATVQSATVELKQELETRMEAYNAIGVAAIDAAEDRLRKSVRTVVLQDIFGAMQQIQASARVLDTFSLTQSLCDAIVDDEGDVDECSLPIKKRRLIDQQQIVMGQPMWV